MERLLTHILGDCNRTPDHDPTLTRVPVSLVQASLKGVTCHDDDNLIDDTRLSHSQTLKLSQITKVVSSFLWRTREVAFEVVYLIVFYIRERALATAQGV